MTVNPAVLIGINENIFWITPLLIGLAITAIILLLLAFISRKSENQPQEPMNNQTE